MTMFEFNLGPTEFQIDEVVAGSELRFSFKLEYESPSGSGTYLPFDFTGYTLTGKVKQAVGDVTPVATFVITTPGVSGAGWVDVVLGGDVTTAIWTSGRCEFVFSIKMTPVADATAGVTLVVGAFPVVRRATP